jgi:hypothetical protein
LSQTTLKKLQLFQELVSLSAMQTTANSLFKSSHKKITFKSCRCNKLPIIVTTIKKCKQTVELNRDKPQLSQFSIFQ